jgi:hypothetical protein
MEAVSSSEMMEHVSSTWRTNPQEEQHLNTIDIDIDIYLASVLSHLVTMDLSVLQL